VTLGAGGPIAVGDVLEVDFPEHRPPGSEQEGTRPALVVGLPRRLGIPRYPVLLVAPLTSDRGQAWAGAAPALYPRLSEGGLPAPSLLLLDQVRSLDLSRVVKRIGKLSNDEYAPIAASIRYMLFS
jgi:mRNA interferase MazF